MRESRVFKKEKKNIPISSNEKGQSDNSAPIHGGGEKGEKRDKGDD